MKFEILRYGIYGAVIAVILFFIFSCNDVKQHPVLYTAVKGKDTAFLEITAYKNRFYGTYEVYYGSRSMKDSGAVEGEISGDTLRGKFRYISYGGSKTINPIIFLRNGQKLIQGHGVVASYMGISYFMPDNPIEFNDSFVFDPVSQKKKSEIGE
ncbi:hypothetical protein SAMN02927916_3221 [Flavobacterium anhuiense]|uniref:Lipoprotein n=1 Tax=Flavobacterium anhuiense TaxID=459526 RepID=A0ABY0LX92_9FLAO|nr:hypothetical protein [Flavobacterium anhuiense]SCY75702.1 hypothetical protein SAMN02927916_3221 [Flavobacterium anhuiense]